MKEVEHIKNLLLKGDIKQAFKIKESILDKVDKYVKQELTEIAREAMIEHLKNGSIKKAELIVELFPMSKAMLRDTLKQAMLSSFRDGDLKRVIEIKNHFPLPKNLGKELVEYCTDKEKNFCKHCILSVFA